MTYFEKLIDKWNCNISSLMPHEILSEPPRGVGWVALTGGTWILIYVKEGFSHPYIKGRQS